MDKANAVIARQEAIHAHNAHPKNRYNQRMSHTQTTPPPTPRTYCVGGAVRDALMGLPANDADYVVVGSTPEAMLAQGYTPVGKDFPVFLHPVTHDEYALARTERKTAQGYAGFAVHFAPDVTLEEDLARRDLTINAMAREVLPNGTLAELIDPYHGQADIQNKILRHVSPAFAEDPVRILRLARFAARWADFSVAPETMNLMRAMVDNGETRALVPERVWTEIARGLMEVTPSRMFVILRECGLLAQWLPEVNALFGVPQRADYHPEIDTGIHVMMVIDYAAKLNLNLESRYAALCHDLGKGNTPAEILPRHVGHESRGVPLAKALSERLKVPRACADYARLLTHEHTNFYKLPELRPSTVLNIIKRCDGLRRPERFRDLLHASLADSRGRGGDFPNRPALWYDAWLMLLDTLLGLDNGEIALAHEHEPEQIPNAILEAQLHAITPVLKGWQESVSHSIL